MLDADLIRDLIRRQEAGRPRSRQTAIGPSDLSSPCSRKLGYQILGVPHVTTSDVSLQAWVGTAIHASLEQAAANDDDWVTEQRVSLDLGNGISITGTLDAYHKPTCSVLDYKSTGPSAHEKYRRQSPENYLDQVAIYGLMAVLTGRMQVKQTALVYIPRNSSLSDIHVDSHPWDEARADNAIRKLEALHAATAAGPAVLPLLPTGDACRFCSWWNPNAWADGVGCPGHQTPGATPVETQPNTQKETAND